VSGPERRPTRCTAPGCHVALPDYNGRGRPRLYCCARCRSAGRAAARHATLNVEVDHTGGDDAGRPIGRVWLVRLRRGTETVTVATELGRPTADHLAGQIAQLIDGRQRASGPAME
jgi:hypothetical protein